MSERRPYDGYEPNEPVTEGGGSYVKKPLTPAKPLIRTNPTDAESGIAAPRWPGDAMETPMKPERAYTQRTWDEEDYVPNEASGIPAGRIQKTEYSQLAGGTPRRASRMENPYSRATWDETEYVPDVSATRITSDVGQDYMDASSDIYDDVRENDAQEASPVEHQAAFDPATMNRYARPVTDSSDGVSDLSARFAPPLKFELTRKNLVDTLEPTYPYEKAEPNVYQTRKPAIRTETNAGFDPTLRDAYRVEEEGGPRRSKRKSKALRRLLIAIIAIVMIGAVSYFNRGWILEQLKPLLGEKTVESVNQAVNQAVNGAQIQSVGYDPAPVLKIGEQAGKGMNAVAGGIGLETYAVTSSNVVSRVSTADGKYDYYLFAAKDGQLLGYYEGLGEDGFIVCPNDVYYIDESPYLIDSQGLPLIDASRYQQSAGADAVLGPMINGWSIISNAKGTSYNYINADGKFLSTLWFTKAYPFTGNATIAYVDTGNVTDPEERYTLYEISHTGDMTLWKHTANMDQVLGCACGIACLTTGEMILLDGKQTVLYTSDDISVYVDCGAVVVRDPKTGKYGLFVNGEQHYDFTYDSIAPVPSDIQWKETANGLYKQFTVTGISYPLPLSHYFSLKKGDAQEMVALSTASVYPLVLDAGIKP